MGKLMSTTKKLQEGVEKFRPRARLVSVLGDQLIRDVTIGLLELVKNGYDADANTVTVRLLNLAPSKDETIEITLEKTTIIVEDDGDGMNLETVLNRWLEPATGNKEEAKKEKKRSKKGRLPLGEKGVGRFAAQKIGRKLELISRAKDSKGNLENVEVVVSVNWDSFDDPKAYLDEVKVNYKERLPVYFTEQSGTILKMQHVRSLWKESDVERISRALRRLMSPFKTPKSFNINLECPDYPKYQNLDSGELLNTAHAELTILVGRDGKAEYDYKFHLEPFPKRQISKEIDLRLYLSDWNPPSRISECGGFFCTFYIWDRDQTTLNLSKTPINDLNMYNGISVFRDGIRVMPYGEPEDDWLYLDKSRYMKTTEAISRKNIVGAVEINQEANEKLIDKSNREGFIENNAYEDFYLLMTTIIDIVHKEFSEDRIIIRSIQKEKKQELTPAINQLENSLKKASLSLDDLSSLSANLISKGKIDEFLAQEITSSVEKSKQILKSSICETRQAASDTLSFFEEKQEMLLSLAGTGLAAEKFTHEFARLTREARLMTREIASSADIRGLENIRLRVRALEATIDALHDMITALSPMFYIRRKSKEDVYDVKTLAEDALLLNRSAIRENKIHAKINQPQGDLRILIRRGNLLQVFNNLIDNSCFWLGRKANTDEKNIIITILANENSVIIADDGPGIEIRDRKRIFDPFYSRKINGRGLGLFISREVLADSQSTLELITDTESPWILGSGATFRIQFPESRNLKYTKGGI